MAEQKDSDKVKDTQDDAPPPLSEIYFLMITVIRAENLERADWNGSSDPFVKVTAAKQTFQTKHINKNLNPEWNESTSFVFFEPVAQVLFEVFDFDEGALGGKHDAIGNYTLDVSQFYADGNAGCDGSSGFALQEAKKGTLFVKVEGRTVKPVELEERVEALTAQVAQQEEQISAKQQEKSALESKKQANESRKAEMQAEQSELNSQLTGIRQRIQQQKDNNRQTQAEIEALQKSRDALQAQMSEKRSQIAAKRQELEAEQRKLAEEKQQYEALKREAQQLEQDCK